MLTITEAAKTVLDGILAEHPGKMLRLVFEGFG